MELFSSKNNVTLKIHITILKFKPAQGSASVDFILRPNVDYVNLKRLYCSLREPFGTSRDIYGHEVNLNSQHSFAQIAALVDQPTTANHGDLSYTQGRLFDKP